MNSSRLALSSQTPMKIAVAILVASLLWISPTTVSSAQGFTEGPDYAFAYSTYDIGDGPKTIRVNWNLYGGATNLDYYINAKVLDAGFGPAIRAAFDTWENDPGSKISFNYLGRTDRVSELVAVNNGNGTFTWEAPTDNFNVISFNPLPNGIVGRGGLQGPFAIGSNGLPSGTGDGVFDISLLGDAGGNDIGRFANGAVPGKVDMESVVLHEIGHVLGLAHPSANPTAVMAAELLVGATRHTLTAADKAAVALLYPEPVVPGVTLCFGKVPTIDMTTGAAGEGTAADDVILGTNGPDVIVGRGGNDTICGQGGDDLIIGGDGGDIIHGNSGNDTINGNTGPDVLNGGPGNDSVVGGSGDDRLYGASGSDLLRGQNGADQLYGFSGDDKLFGGAGNDYLAGHAGDDLLSGEDGNDKLFGGKDFDDIRGGDGADQMSGGSQADSMLGGPGNDVIFGDDGNDTMSGQSGNDTLVGGGNNDRMFGGPGTDTCDASIGVDTKADCT